MQTRLRSEKPPRNRPVPWWMHNQQLVFPFGREPDAEPTAPPRSQLPEASHSGTPAHEAADACPDMLPDDMREVYESVFGLPALYAEASCPDADERPLADMDTPRAEVVA